MIDIRFEILRNIGLTQTIANQLHALNQPIAEGARLMRVTEVQRDRYTVHDGANEHSARVLHKLTQALQQKEDALTVGDRVLVEAHANDELWIAMRLPPVTQITRRANDGRRQALASNVDTALLVMGLEAHCQFRDCRHEQEPGCAVREQVPADRLLNYHKLLRDAARAHCLAGEVEGVGEGGGGAGAG